MTEKRKSPALRFRGYTDDWEQRKLGELLTQRVEHQKISEKEPLLAFSYAEGVIDPEDKKSNKRDFIMTDKYNKIFSRTEVEDIIYNPANVIHGAIHRNALKTGVVSPIYKIFKCNEDISPKYMGEMLHTDKFISEITKYIEGTVVKLRTLSPEKFLDMEIELPKFMEEQEAIGSFFTNIDSLITLHQRKLEKLKLVKKSMLEKMFPKNGSSVSEIRFNGFTDDWEQRKVTEIGKIYIGLVTTMTKHYTDEGTLLIRNSDIKDGKFEFGDNPIHLEKSFAEKNETRMHQIGDVITVHTGDVGTSAVITENEEKSIGFATIVTRPNHKIIDSNYLCSFLNTDNHKKWAVSISTGDGRTNYNLGDYFELVVPVPSIAEQKKIAAYIQILNRLITLHQHKVEKLQIMKKSMLEKMFV